MIEGRAEFVDNHTTCGSSRATGTRELRGEKIFINTGAQSTMPDIKGLSSTPGVFDSTGLLNLAQRPQRLGDFGRRVHWRGIHVHVYVEAGHYLRPRRYFYRVKTGMSLIPLPTFARQRCRADSECQCTLGIVTWTVQYECRCRRDAFGGRAADRLGRKPANEHCN